MAPGIPPHQCAGAATPGERLLLQAMRGWAGLRARGERPHQQLAHALQGRVSSRVIALLIAWLQAIEAETLAPIQMSCAECGGASGDEQRLIFACGLAPVAAELGEELLAPLLRNPQPVMVIGRALNVALAAEGVRLPARLIAGVGEHQGPRPTLH